MCGVLPGVPTGKDCEEPRLALRVGLLVTTQITRGAAWLLAAAARGWWRPGSSPGPGVKAGVLTEGVAVPDLHVGSGDGVARPGVLDREDDGEGKSALALADVPASEVVVDPIRPLGDLGRQNARRRSAAVGSLAGDAGHRVVVATAGEQAGDAGAAEKDECFAAAEAALAQLAFCLVCHGRDSRDLVERIIRAP